MLGYVIEDGNGMAKDWFEVDQHSLHYGVIPLFSDSNLGPAVARPFPDDTTHDADGTKKFSPSFQGF